VGGGEFEDGICIPFVVPLDARVLLGSSFRFQPSIATSSVISRPIDSDGDSLMLELDCHAIATGYPSGLIGFQGIDSVHAIRVQGRTCAPGYVTFTRDAQRRRLSSLLRRGARARLRQERKWPPPSSRRHFLRDPSHFPFIRRPARARLNVKVIHSSSVFYESRPRRTLNPDLSLSLSLLVLWTFVVPRSHKFLQARLNASVKRLGPLRRSRVGTQRSAVFSRETP